MAFAGLWEWWKTPDETLVRTFTILTTIANATMRMLHERMPVILEPDAWSVWLGEESGARAHLMCPVRQDTHRVELQQCHLATAQFEKLVLPGLLQHAVEVHDT